MKVIELILSDVDVKIAIELVKDNLGRPTTIEEAIEILLDYHNVTGSAKDITDRK
jgi:hypothetical protein